MYILLKEALGIPSTEAQQGLRREIAQLRDGVEKNRQGMEQITQQQLVGISNLRSLHDHWLQGDKGAPTVLL